MSFTFFYHCFVETLPCDPGCRNAWKNYAINQLIIEFPLHCVYFLQHLWLTWYTELTLEFRTPSFATTSSPMLSAATILFRTFFELDSFSVEFSRHIMHKSWATQFLPSSKKSGISPDVSTHITKVLCHNCVINLYAIVHITEICTSIKCKAYQ